MSDPHENLAVSMQSSVFQGALCALEVFCEQAHLDFNRSLASRALAEAVHSMPGEDAPIWARRLIEIGDNLDLRIWSRELALRDVLSMVTDGVCAAHLIETGSGLEWVVLKSEKRRLYRVSGSREIPISRRELQRLVRAESTRDRRLWVFGEPAMPAAASSHHDSHGGHHAMKPLSRLLAFVRPEGSDILLITLFSLVVGVLSIGTPIAIESLVNLVAFGQQFQPVVILSAILFIFLGFSAILRAMIAWVAEIIQRRMFVRVVEDLAFRLPRVPQQAWDAHYGPELVNRFFEVVNVQKVVASLLIDGLGVVVQTFIGMAVLAFYHPFLLGFDVILVILITGVTYLLGRNAMRTAILESRAKFDTAAWLQEIARHPSAFKFHSGWQLALDRSDALAAMYVERRRAHFLIVFRQIIFALGLQALSATILLGLGGWLVIQGELTLGQLVAAELIVTVITGSFTKLGRKLEAFFDVLASMDKLGHLFDLPVEPHVALMHLPDVNAAALNVRDVAFHHPIHPSSHRTYSFQVAAGEQVAILGGAGSGKSTLVDLIAGLRQPDEGHIEIDRIDLRELRPDSWRRQLGFCREIEIFEGTVCENIDLNRSEISAADIRDALQTVGLLDEILNLPDGLLTPLHTDGRLLSKGQRLRLMIARAIVGCPRLVVVDGTLDALGDHELGAALQGLRNSRRWTLVVTTTREEVARQLDRVIPVGDHNVADSEVSVNSDL